MSINRESARRIEAHYREKGFAFATVELEKGDSKDDREVIFVIHEGPKVRVSRVKFTGHDFVSGPVLKTKLHTKTAILGLLGGLYDPSTIPDDVAALQQYYHRFGFFDVKIAHDVTFNKTRSKARIEYVIDEGVRYKLRNVEFHGNSIFTEQELRKDLKLTSGESFNLRKLNRDVAGLK